MNWVYNACEFVHRKEVQKLTFRALALRRSEWIRPSEGLTFETSAFEIKRGPFSEIF